MANWNAGTRIWNCISRKVNNAAAAIKNNHRYFNIIFQKEAPLNTKQKPKKNANSPSRNPCQVMAYISYGFGLTSIASAAKAEITSNNPSG